MSSKWKVHIPLKYENGRLCHRRELPGCPAGCYNCSSTDDWEQIQSIYYGDLEEFSDSDMDGIVDDGPYESPYDDSKYSWSDDEKSDDE